MTILKVTSRDENHAKTRMNTIGSRHQLEATSASLERECQQIASRIILITALLFLLAIGGVVILMASWLL